MLYSPQINKVDLVILLQLGIHHMSLLTCSNNTQITDTHQVCSLHLLLTMNL